MSAAIGSAVRSDQKSDEFEWAKEKSNLRVKAENTLSYDDLANRVDVTRRDVMRQVLKKQLDNTRGCATLPITLAFFCLFTFSAMLHEDITNIFLLESAVRRDLRGDLESLHTIDDLWDWLETGFVDKFFIQENDFGEPLPQDEWSRVLIYSQVQGSIVLRQSRQNSDPWGVPLMGPLDVVTSALNASDDGFLSIQELDGSRRLREESVPAGKRLDGRQLDMMRPEMMASLPAFGPEAKTFDFLFYPNMPREEIDSRLRYIHDRHWLDEDTSIVSIEMILLNAELGRPRLEQLKIWVSFSRGGGMFYYTSLQSVFLKDWNSMFSVGVDGLWIIMLIGTTLWRINMVCKACFSEEMKKHFKDGLTVLEWVIVVWGWGNVIGFLLQTQMTTSLKENLSDVNVLMADANATQRMTSDDASELIDVSLDEASALLHESANAVIWLIGNWRLAISWYNIILMIRFFSAFRVQPRLAIVTNTLKCAVTDLLHFAAVFFPTFMAYVISGNLLFGRRMESFSTLQASFAQCFRIVIENEYEWEVMSAEHFVTSALWTWSFLLLVVLIMLNMVLAIILDIYNEVRSGVDSSDTIFVFLDTLIRRTWNIRKWVPELEVDDILNGVSGSTTISREELRVMLPDMPETQMDGLFKACKNEMAWQGKQDLHKATFLKLSTAVKTSVDKVNARVKRIHENPVRDPAAERARRAAAAAAAAQAAVDTAAKAARSSVRKPAKASPRNGAGKRRGSLGSKGSLGSSGKAAAAAAAAAAEIAPPPPPVVEHFRQPEASRLQGSSQPFPGMPKMPGGYWPPLLSPAEAHEATKKLEARQAEPCSPDGAPAQAERPEWFQDLTQQMEMQNTGMLQIQWQLQSLQWQWDLMQRATAEAEADLRRSAAGPDEENHNLPYDTPSGVRIL